MSLTFAEGTPCWVDLATADPGRARDFYGALFGWTFADQGEDMGNYLMCSKDGATVAGMGPLQVPEMPSAWTIYLSVNDVAAAVEKVTAAGGQVVAPPMEIPGSGHMAIVTDPTGGVVGLWQKTSFAGMEAMGSHGSPCWFEENSWEAERARDFFVGLFGLEVQKMEGAEYWTLHEGGRPRYGMLQMTKDWEGMPPHWMPYFAVESADEAATAVAEHGGKAMHGPFDTPFGRIVVCTDPTGAAFSLVQLTE